MNLHKDKNIFTDIYLSAAEAMGIKDPGIVEKDYYVTMFLKDISALQPNIIFKGGTSLSKCYKVINRFSEDIDLSLISNAGKVTQGQRKELSRDILSVIDKNGFDLLNPEQIRSRYDYNRYVVDFKSTRAHLIAKQNLIVETSLFIRSFPIRKLYASSIIYDFLAQRDIKDAIAQYGLEPFQINVLSEAGTFIDKVFALGDYYLSGAVNTHSRHIYDLYKLLPLISFDNSLRKLVCAVREARKAHPAYLSAQDGVDMAQLLHKIVKEKYYKNDYERITQALLFEHVTYAEAIRVIDEIIDSKCFDKAIIEGD